MALTIDESIFVELTPPLNSDNPNDLEVVEKWKKQAFYALQVSLEKTDLEVENENAYTNQEKLLIAYYAVWLYLSKVYKSALSADTALQSEKRIKADVTEIEYNSGSFDVKGSLNNALKKLCSKALELGLSLPICLDCFKTDSTLAENYNLAGNSAFMFYTPSVYVPETS